MAKKQIEIEWEVVDGRIARRGQKRLIYPDILADDPFERFYGWLNSMRQNGATWEELEPHMKAFHEAFRDAVDHNREWLMLNGMMVKRGVKRGKNRLTYPDRLTYHDPLSDDFVESHFGCLNMMRQLGREEERERAHREFCETIHRLQGPQAEPMPKDFSARMNFGHAGLESGSLTLTLSLER